MKRGTLALLVLLGGAVSTATADYILIVANFGQLSQLQTPPPPVPGAPGGGVIGGGFRGGQPVTPPAVPPPPAMRGPAPPPSGPFDPDTAPLLTLAVVEVEKNMTQLDVRNLAAGRPVGAPPIGPPRPSLVHFKLGNLDGKIYLSNTSSTTIYVLHPDGDKKPVPPLHRVYEEKVKDLTSGKTPATAAQLVDLAEWCLAHGMLDRFKEHMDKAAELDKADAKVAGYLQMKATLAKPVDSTDTAGPWRKQLLTRSYQTTLSAHYALLQNDNAAAESRIKRMEDALQGYYYWFAVRGLQLPVPGQRLVGVLTSDSREFKRLHSTLDSTPIVSDAFYARHENLVVFSSRRLDDSYEHLKMMSDPLWAAGFSLEDLLKGKGFPTKAGVKPEQIYQAMTFALLHKVMQLDGEVAGTSHGVTRQMLYSSGFLPPSVMAPEWAQFGVSTFFETAPGSPWPTFGLPHFVYWPLYRDLVSAKKLPPDQLDLLKMVVTDGYFRKLSFGEKKEEADRRKARATAWSLTNFLIRKRLDGWQRYFKELSQLPRDMPLDEETLWRAFARAFNAVDATGQPDLNALKELADDWDKDTRLEQYDNREISVMRTIWQSYKEAAARQSAPPTPGAPGAVPGAVPGAPPAGGPLPGGRPGRPGPGQPGIG
jgi:hypothetical protein